MHLHTTILEPCPICELEADGPCPACNARGVVDYGDVTGDLLRDAA